VDTLRIDTDSIDQFAPRLFGVRHYDAGGPNAGTLSLPRPEFDRSVLEFEPRGRAIIEARPGIVHAVHPVDAGPDTVSAVDHDTHVATIAGDRFGDRLPAPSDQKFRYREGASRPRDDVYVDSRIRGKFRDHAMGYKVKRRPLIEQVIGKSGIGFVHPAFSMKSSCYQHPLAN